MRSDGEQQRSPVWRCVTGGVFHGLIAGALVGPGVMIAWMIAEDYLYPSTAFLGTGLEVPLSVIIGAILGAVEGPVFGLLRAIKPPRMTLWWLMTAVAIFGLILGIFVLHPVLGLIALTVPVVMAVSMRVAAVIPTAGPTDGRNRRRSDFRPQSTAWLYERRTRWQEPPEMGNEPNTGTRARDK